jgi:hypothetical protein
MTPPTLPIQVWENPREKTGCHLIWCDHRAFKDSSIVLRDELELKTGAPVKTHKTADNCIRLFRKKQRAQGRPPCVILVSAANALALLDYLGGAGAHVTARVIILCDARTSKRAETMQDFTSLPQFSTVVNSWEDAVAAVCAAVATFS